MTKYQTIVDRTAGWTPESLHAHLNLAEGWAYVIIVSDETLEVYVLDSEGSSMYATGNVRLHQRRKDCISDIEGLIL